MKIVVAFSIVIFSLYACGDNAQSFEQPENNNDKLDQVEEVELVRINALKDGGRVQKWVNDILDSKYLDNYELSKETMANLHNPSQTDTIYNYKSEHSEIGVLSASGKRLLLDCNVFGSDVGFDDDRIYVGCSKQDVFDVLGMRFTNDTLKVMEPDGYGIYFELYFEDDMMYGYHYHSIVD